MGRGWETWTGHNTEWVKRRKNFESEVLYMCCVASQHLYFVKLILKIQTENVTACVVSMREPSQFQDLCRRK